MPKLNTTFPTTSDFRVIQPVSVCLHRAENGRVLVGGHGFEPRTFPV